MIIVVVHFAVPMLARLNKTDYIVHQIKRFSAGQVTLDGKSFVIHQKLLEVPRDVITPHRGPQDRTCVRSNDPTREGTARLQREN